ncbi:MAG: FecR domain-containing protein [Bacteriovoracia bacterium]
MGQVKIQDSVRSSQAASLWFEFPRALAAAVALCVLFSAVSVLAVENAGQVVSLSGKVLIRNEANVGGKAMREVKAGDKIYKGDIVNTDSTASMKLLMTDKSVLDLGPSTLFKVDDYQLNKGADRKVDLSMSYGKIRASITQKLAAKGQFKIKTKAATMGVRGTEFLVNAGVEGPGPGGKGPKGAAAGGNTTVQVIEGLVAVNTGAKKQAIPLAQGQALQAKIAAPGEKGRGPSATPVEVKVAQMTKLEMKAAVSEVKVADNTFKAAVVIDNSSLGSEKSGAITMGVLQTAMAGAMAEISQSAGPSAHELGLPGTFTPADMGFGGGAFNPGLNNQRARVNVTFRK